LRNPQRPSAQQRSQLKLATCCLSIFYDLSGFAISGIEGRCSLQYWNEDPAAPAPSGVLGSQTQKRSFAFRCHRVDNSRAYSVHDISMYPNNPDIFSTCGGDGRICIWDKKARHRLRQFERIPLPVTQAKFNVNGALLAYAVGYDWAEGADVAPGRQGVGIFVHKVTQNETIFTNKKR